MKGQRTIGDNLAINVDANERLISVMGGAVLLLYALTRLPWTVGTLILGGGYLLYRGFTGHCFGYEALGIDRATTERLAGTAEWISNVPPKSVERSDAVAEASWESFPASDPPSTW